MVIAYNYSTPSCHVAASTSTACRGPLLRVPSLGDAIALLTPCCGHLLRLEPVWSRAPSFVFASPPVAGALGNQGRRTCPQTAFAGSNCKAKPACEFKWWARGVWVAPPHLSLELRRVVVQHVCGHGVHDIVNSRLQEYQLRTHITRAVSSSGANHVRKHLPTFQAYLQPQEHRVDTQHRPPVVPENRHHDFARCYVHIWMPHSTATTAVSYKGRTRERFKLPSLVLPCQARHAGR